MQHNVEISTSIEKLLDYLYEKFHSLHDNCRIMEKLLAQQNQNYRKQYGILMNNIS